MVTWRSLMNLFSVGRGYMVTWRGLVNLFRVGRDTWPLGVA